MADQKILRVANLSVRQVVHLCCGQAEARTYLLEDGSIAVASDGGFEAMFSFLGNYTEAEDPLGTYCRVIPPGRTRDSLLQFRYNYKVGRESLAAAA